MVRTRSGKPKHIPQRSCIVCQQKTDKRRLVRLVDSKAGLVVDLSGKQNGRGAYLCRQPTCWDTILTKPVLDRVFSRPVTVTEKEVVYTRRPQEGV